MPNQTDNLLRLLDMAGHHAHKILIEQQQELVPVYLLKSPMEQALISCPWQDDEQKDVMIATVKLKAHAMGATALSVVSEAWALRTPDGVYPPGPIREQPQRIEIVHAIATDGRRIVTRSWRQLRDKPGGRLLQLVQFGDVDTAQGQHVMSGRLIDGMILR